MSHIYRKWLVDNRTIKYNQRIARDCDELRRRRTFFGWNEHYRFLLLAQPVDEWTNCRVTLTGGTRYFDALQLKAPILGFRANHNTHIIL